MFHQAIQQRQMHNKVLHIESMSGVDCRDPGDILKAFLDYYETLFGSSAPTSAFYKKNIPTEEEIRKVIFSIPNDKSPGPDGYTSCFYKASWETIHGDLCAAIKDFFIHRKLLKQINSTNIVLIPKLDNPKSVKDFRPISCCNTIYKLISKLLCNRLSGCLPKIINPAQCAFIKGRSILGNILISQDLVRLYERKSASPKCLMKVDLRKAYDFIEWDFVANMLDVLHFPPQFIKLIMQCVSTTSYSIGLNGQNYGFFHGKRGLRQGDPISPLIFTLCMEYLNRLLVMGSGLPGFKFHPLCRSLRLTHLMFADDLLLFCKGEVKSICILMELLKDFPLLLACVSTMISLIFIAMVCNLLWFLRFLCCLRVMDRIQALCRNFLWEGSDKYSKAPLVSWNVLCNSKEHGGLGLIDSKQWNIAAIGKLVWWLATKQDHLWIKWVDNIYLKGKNWMLYEPPPSSTWAWRKICDVKNVFKPGYAQGNWCGDDCYTIPAGYEWLRQEHLLKVPWYSVVWNRYNVPKWSFTMWLQQQQRLLTLDRLVKMGMEVSNECFLCGIAPESHSHLFSDCAYALKCHQLIADWLHLPKSDIADCVKIAKKHGQSMLIRQITLAVAVGTVYWIWMARNTCRIDGYVIHPVHLVQRVKEDCRRRLLGIFQGDMK
ncbi:uncharacterized protein LOC141590932 [Silene latifolia]|uniref:uncharacterized protein LOC141590932 n=1 Tax=Silene latifolia TaxID=37657 RepID=UPI003D77B583